MRMIRDFKRTEQAFTGEYWDNFKDGIYVCRNCGLPLFDAKSKFEASCGWPSFDDSFKFAVKELIDDDRTEVVCARCGIHLGHVFKGEAFTDKDIRNCVNSFSIKFIPLEQSEEYRNRTENTLNPQEIVLGGGCFWCIEAAMLRMPGVLNSVSGYAGGTTENPTYERVCSGTTGHAEVVRLTYDKNTIALTQLLDMFFRIHDPTSLNKQGNDVGTEYRSIIFYKNATEKDEIGQYIQEKQREFDQPIVTEVVPLTTIYEAETYHQRYFEKNPYAGYCQVIVRPKIDKVLSGISA